ncbi:hypothetical protein CW304_27735 [Bacillus sp. UFRGS-B20]|nr:hypothetical protein CW304_27735 [Bacillus sp. UFRGS-B20]
MFPSVHPMQQYSGLHLIFPFFFPDIFGRKTLSNSCWLLNPLISGFSKVAYAVLWRCGVYICKIMCGKKPHESLFFGLQFFDFLSRSLLLFFLSLLFSLTFTTCGGNPFTTNAFPSV